MLINCIIFGKGLEAIRKDRTNIADELGMEVAEVIVIAKDINHHVREQFMDAVDLKERQFDELLKDFRKRIKKFPEL